MQMSWRGLRHVKTIGERYLGSRHQDGSAGDASDGFSEAYYGRPERLLEAGARLANSAWSFVEPDAEQRFVKRLDHDIKSGAWDAKYGQLRRQSHFDGSLRLIVGTRKW
jgi:hypothetical protein